MIDLVVVGGGPAGLATVLYATRAGLDVVLVERRRAQPVDKACGEGLMPQALAALQALGVDPPGHRITGIRYVDGPLAVDADFPGGAVGRGVRRLELSAALRAAVSQAGVPLVENSVERVEQDGSTVSVGGIRARYAVAADGLHSPLRRSLGLDRAVPGRPRYGMRRHFAVTPWSAHVEVHWSATSEAYITPVGPDCVGVAVLTSAPGPYEQQIAAFPSVRDRVSGREVSDVRGAGPLCQRAVRRTAGRVLLVGDAAGYVDALTGEGIAVSMASARAAVAAVAADRPDQYELAWRRLSARYRWLTAGLLAVSGNPAIRRRLVPAAAAAPWLFRAAVGQLAR